MRQIGRYRVRECAHVENGKIAEMRFYICGTSRKKDLSESKLRLGCPRRVKFRGQNLICGYGGIGRRARFRFLWRQLCTGSSPATRTTSEQSKLCSAFICIKNIRLQTADVFIPFRERLYFIHRNIAIRNDNIIFL